MSHNLTTGGKEIPSDYNISLRIGKNNLFIINSRLPMDILSIGSPSLFCLLKTDAVNIPYLSQTAK